MSCDDRHDPPVEPGQAWVCENGTRHFVCAECEGVFDSNPGFDEDQRCQEAIDNLGSVPEEDDRCSVCDGCYPKLLAKARVMGLIPDASYD